MPISRLALTEDSRPRAQHSDQPPETLLSGLLNLGILRGAGVQFDKVAQKGDTAGEDIEKTTLSARLERLLSGGMQ